MIKALLTCVALSMGVVEDLPPPLIIVEEAPHSVWHGKYSDAFGVILLEGDCSSVGYEAVLAHELAHHVQRLERLPYSEFDAWVAAGRCVDLGGT